MRNAELSGTFYQEGNGLVGRAGRLYSTQSEGLSPARPSEMIFSQPIFRASHGLGRRQRVWAPIGPNLIISKGSAAEFLTPKRQARQISEI